MLIKHKFSLQIPRFNPCFYLQKYMLPLKTSCSSVDENLVDNIFYMIPEILMHHTVYRNALDRVWTNWDTETSTMGNLISATVSMGSV